MTLDLRSRASDDLLIASNELIFEGLLETPEDVMAFFEKPWKWAPELEEMGIKIQVN